MATGRVSVLTELTKAMTKALTTVGPLLKKVGNLLTQEMGKAMVLNASFTSSSNPRSQRPVGKVRSQAAIPLVQEDQIREYVSKLDIPKSLGPDGMQPRVLRELADVIARPLSIIFYQSLKLGEVAEEWRKSNVCPIFKKSKKEDPGNCRPVSLTSLPGKVIEQRILETVFPGTLYWFWLGWR